jgi:hypothetical protein
MSNVRTLFGGGPNSPPRTAKRPRGKKLDPDFGNMSAPSFVRLYMRIQESLMITLPTWREKLQAQIPRVIGVLNHLQRGGPTDPITLDASYRQSEKDGYGGDGPKKVSPGQNVSIEIECELGSFEPVDIVVDASIARYFDIISFKVGRDEQLCSQKPVSATHYASDQALRRPNKMMTCKTHLKMCLVVRNIGQKPHTFRAVVVGRLMPTPWV